MKVDNFVFLIFGIIVALAVVTVVIVYKVDDNEKLRKLTMICSLVLVGAVFTYGVVMVLGYQFFAKPIKSTHFDIIATNSDAIITENETYKRHGINVIDDGNEFIDVTRNKFSYIYDDSVTYHYIKEEGNK